KDNKAIKSRLVTGGKKEEVCAFFLTRITGACIASVSCWLRWLFLFWLRLASAETSRPTATTAAPTLSQVSESFFSWDNWSCKVCSSSCALFFRSTSLMFFFFLFFSTKNKPTQSAAESCLKLQ